MEEGKLSLWMEQSFFIVITPGEAQVCIVHRDYLVNIYTMATLLALWRYLWPLGVIRSGTTQWAKSPKKKSVGV